jgi:hypothetical protein
MKGALIAIAGVGILATTAGVETANAQYGSPPPPAYTAPPAYSPAPAYAPSPRYTRRAYRRSARQTSGAPTATAYTPGSDPPPYSVSQQTYAAQSSGPWEWHAGPGPKKRGGECVTDVDINRGYGFRGPCPQQRAALNPQPLPPRR